MAFYKSTETPVLCIPRRILNIAAGDGLHPGFSGASISLDTHYFFSDGDETIAYYDAAACFVVNGKYVHAGGQFNSLDAVETFLRTGEIDRPAVELEFLSLASALARVSELKKEDADAQPA